MNEQPWRTSSYTAAQGNCVEVGGTDHAILIRDSKDRTGETLTFTVGTRQSFTNSLK